MHLINYWQKAIRNEISEKKLLEKIKKSYPPLLSATFTRQCVLNCRHCVYPKANQSDLSLNNLSRINKIIKAARRAGVNDLIHVGKILKREHLPILKKYYDRGMIINLIDNGSAARLIPEIKKTDLYFNGGIDISIDGNKKTHELQRGQGAYKLAIGGAKALREVANHISITGTASTLNYSSLVKGLCELKKELPFVKILQISTVSPANFQKNRMHLNKKEMQKLFSCALRASKRHKLSLAIFRVEDFAAISSELAKYGKPKNKYISIEWKINNLTLSYFPVSIVCAEEFAIDANGSYVMPFGLDHHLKDRPNKWQLPGDLILKDPDKAYEKLAEKYFKNVGRNALTEEKIVFEILGARLRVPGA